MPQLGLPTSSDPSQAQDVQKNTQVALQPTVSLPSTPVAPRNFKAVSSRGGVTLSWSPLIANQGSTVPLGSNQVSPSDGYELQISPNGDFSPGKYQSIGIRDPSQTTYFHSAGAGVVTNYYQLRATNGTASNPYSVHGIFTGVIQQSSIDATDPFTSPTTVNDTFTSDKTQARARAWKSGTQYPNQR